jgi:glutaminyl-peptide cyclotransferase
MKLLCVLSIILILGSCNNDKPPADEGQTQTTKTNEPANISYSVVNIYPHDTSSFTEGLQWHDGYLYESTGMEGESRLMKVNLKDGKAAKKIDLDKSLFGEGVTVLNNKIYQLTWKNNKAFVYDLPSFKKLKEFTWDFDGWGMTTDGKNLIITTGGNNLYFVDPETFKILNTVSVFSNYGPLGEINELEYVDGKIYANVWQSDYIVRINPETGSVEARIDFADILKKTGKEITPNTDVLNGIAYNATTKTFFVTGKRWPALYEVKLNQ